MESLANEIIKKTHKDIFEYYFKKLFQDIKITNIANNVFKETDIKFRCVYINRLYIETIIFAHQIERHGKILNLCSNTMNLILDKSKINKKHKRKYKHLFNCIKKYSNSNINYSINMLDDKNYFKLIEILSINNISYAIILDRDYYDEINISLNTKDIAKYVVKNMLSDTEDLREELLATACSPDFYCYLHDFPEDSEMIMPEEKSLFLMDRKLKEKDYEIIKKNYLLQKEISTLYEKYYG
jgi:hypothetical protein